MTFSKFVAIFAITAMALQANAYNDGTLRRSVKLAQADISDADAKSSQGAVIINNNTNTNTSSAATDSQAQQATVVQPATIVEANPVNDSRAEGLRRARQGAEIQTEQKIVEKLEDSRLQDERNRAERLFGNRLDAQPAPAPAPAPIPAPAPAPAVVAPAPVVEEKPTQVTIEKVEIIQPAAPVVEKEEPVAASKMEAAPVQEAAGQDKAYVSASIGTIAYSASNVKSNFAAGLAIGKILASNWAVEGSFLYSNHFVDTFWEQGLFRELNQYDFGVSARYYLMNDKIKPYVGASTTYIRRVYEQRVKTGSYYAIATDKQTDDVTTDAVNVGVMAGLDFEASPNLLIGGGIEYNRNMFNKEATFSDYGLPNGTRPLEEFDYYTMKVALKYLF